MDIAGCTALVTGAASGLGNATARGLIAAGAQVVLVDLPTSVGSAAADELGADATFAPADVTDADSVAAALDVAERTGRPLRVVVNCAGIAPPAKVVGKSGPFPLDQFRATLEVNLLGTFNVIRLAA